MRGLIVFAHSPISRIFADGYNLHNNMDITIRLEQPADYREAETVTREAFWNCYSPGCMEHYLLHVMRRSPRFVRELDFVAVADGKIVGSVVFMKAMIMGDDGNRHEVLTLGPIAVLPAFQRKGIGRMLIEHARTEACRQGYRAMLLCGDPLYYQRVGFVAAEDFGIRTSDNKYLAALQVCPLYDHALQRLAGRYFEDRQKLRHSTGSSRPKSLSRIRLRNCVSRSCVPCKGCERADSS